MCHEWSTCIYVSDEDAHHGASHFCELICRALDSVWKQAQRQNRPMPQHLVVQSDNTTAQAKNSVASICLAYLVLRGKFLTATLNLLSARRTHEDVDRLFALILIRVLRRHRFEVPDDLVMLLQEELLSYVKSQQEELVVERVTNIHDFEDHLAPLGVTLSNCVTGRALGCPQFHL